MKKLTCTCGAIVDVSRFGPGAMIRCARCKRIMKVPKDDPQTKARPVPGARPSPRTTRTTTPRMGMPAIKARPRPSGPNKALLFGGVGALVAVIGIALLLSHNGTQPSGSHEEERAKLGYDQILAKLQPHDGHGWWTVAQACRDNGFKKEYEESLEKAAKGAPEDQEIVAAYRKLAQSWLDALDREKPEFVDEYYKVAERIENAGQKHLAEDLYEDIAGDHLARNSRKKGFDPNHPLANRKLGRMLTPFGTWEDKDLYEDIKAKLENMTARDAYVKSLPPMQRRALEQKDALEKQRGLKFNTLVDPPYLVAVQEANYDPDIILQDFREKVDTLYKMFKADFSEKLHIEKAFEGDDVNLLRIIVYDSRDTYFRQNPDMPEWAGGHFDVQTGDIQVFRGTEDPYGVMFHEGTHQLIAAATKVFGAKDTNTHWLSEGIACYFEGWKRGAQIQLGQVSEKYLPEVQRYVKAGKQLPFEDFVDRSYDKFWVDQNAIRNPYKRQEFVGLSYAQAWSLVYFLRNFDNGKYKEAFNKYLESELHGKGGLDVFKNAIGDPKQIEKEWLEFVRGLRPGGR